jgi:branched-chain amino acid transport system ATP-binding protein
MTNALELSGVTAGYRGVPAIRDVSFHVEAGEVLALLGPNGAGKSTTLLAAVGLVPLMGGAVAYLGESLAGKRVERNARNGLLLVPDDRGVFSKLTVAEHFRLAERGAGGGDGVRQRVLAQFPQLEPLAQRRCGLLSGGEQQMLAVAKALLMQPKVLIIDEMSLGLAPIIVQRLLPVLRDIARDEGMGLVLVEQHMQLALQYSDRAVVLNHGAVVLEGSSPDLLRQPRVVEAAYFGSTAGASSD